MRIIDTVFVYRLAKGEKLAWHGRYHAHNSNEFEIHFFLEGDGVFMANTARHSVSAYSLFLSGPHEFHSIVPQQKSRPLTYYAVLFYLEEEKDPELYLLLTGLLKLRAIKRQSSDAARFLFEELLRLSSSAQPGFEKSALHLLTSLLYRWFSEDVPAGQILQEQSGIKKTAHAIVKNALAYFSANLGNQITIYHAAYKLGLSSEHLIRVFRSEMHMTPYQYLMRLRTEAAAGELITTDDSIADIAVRYAFENQFHFSRVFKRCTGFTPSAYRQCYMQVVH